MTPEQHQEFIEYALQIKWNRDAYSRAWIIEHLMDKVAELVNNSQAQSETFICGANRVMGEKRCESQCGQCEELYSQAAL